MNSGRVDTRVLEEGSELILDFNKLSQVASGEPVVPVVAQEADSGEVLIIAYANQAALEQTMASGLAVFYSTSRQELWIKGESSGDYLDLVEVRVNCEQNSLLYLVKRRNGGACHTRDENNRTRPSCYYRRITDGRLEFVIK